MTASLNVAKELAALKRMTPGQLKERYAEVFGEPSRSANKDFLVRKIIWRLQALAEGDFTQRAARLRERALAIANDADLRTRPPKAPPRLAVTTHHLRLTTDNSLPMPGAILTRQYRGRTIEVRVLPDRQGFEFEGEAYKSLSAVAKAVTGTHWNGRAFFGLAPSKGTAK